MSGIARLDDPNVSDAYRWTEVDEESRSLLAAAVAMYKVYASDERIEPVRGLVFDDVAIRTLRDVAPFGNDAHVWKIHQPLGTEGTTYAAAIVTPDILVEEMELRAGVVHEPVPLST